VFDVSLLVGVHALTVIKDGEKLTASVSRPYPSHPADASAGGRRRLTAGTHTHHHTRGDYGEDSFTSIIKDWGEASWYWEVREEKIVKTIANIKNMICGFTIIEDDPRKKLAEAKKLIQFGIRLASRFGKPYALCYPNVAKTFCRLADAEIVGTETRHGIEFKRLELKSKVEAV